MGLTTKEIGSSSFNDMISSVDRRSEYVENRANANVTLNNFLTPYTLDNKSSILNAPCGYSNGTYASLRPVQTIGPELVINGTFDTDSKWGVQDGWSISGGKANADAAFTNLGQTGFSFVTNKIYKVTYEVENYVSGEIRFQFTGGDTLNGIDRTSNGVYTEYVKAIANHTNFRFRGANFTGSIDNASVKEVTNADFDFSRGSSATRVNEKGLIEDVQILSGNLVQNGDFEEIGSELVTNGNFDTDLNGWRAYSSTLISWESGGYAVVSNNNGYWCKIQQEGNVFEVGKIYKITMRAKSNLANRSFHGDIFTGQSFSEVDTFQTFTQYFKATITGFSVGFHDVSAFGEVTITIDNVSVKEVGQNWTFETGWSMGDGKVIADGTMTDNDNLIQYYNFTDGNKYRFSFTISDYQSGGVFIRQPFNGGAAGDIVNSNGAYTFDYIAGANNELMFRSGSGFTGSIDNVSVIEITDDTDIPRIDYTSGQGALLLEPQSTNKVTQSETFSTWENIFVLLTSTNIVAPDGSNSVIKMSSSNLVVREHKIAIDTNFNNATDTIFAKMGEVRFIYNRRKSSTGSWQFVIFDLQEGVVVANNYPSGTAYPKITYYGNGWYRCEVYYNGLNDAQTGWGLSNGTDENFTPTNTTDGLYIWGAQQEDLSYATSYIPTEGSTVTRNADVANNSGNADLFNDSEGVLYAEIAALANDGTYRSIGISDGTGDNRVGFLLLGSNTIRANVVSNGTGTFDEQYQVTSILDYHKVAVKYKANDFALWIDGVERQTDTSGSTPIGLNELIFTVGNQTSFPFYGNVKSVAVFKEALTDAELAQITSATQQEVFYQMRDRMNIKNYDYYEFGDYTTRLKKLF